MDASPTSRPILPAEWEPHRATWIAWPWDESLWEEDLAPAQAAWLEMATAIATGEALEVLVPSADHLEQCKARLAQLGIRQCAGAAPGCGEVRFHTIPFGDIWMRDIAPLFVRSQGAANTIQSTSFRFNGWGEKYVLAGDAHVSERVAQTCGLPWARANFILEGGSIEQDGLGTVLTTRQCLLNPNRNPGFDQAAVEAQLKAWLGAAHVIWLTEGLLNDHTDGHIDTIARFIAPGEVLCMRPSGPADPNAQVLEQIEAELRAARDARGQALKVHTVPSPGAVVGRDAEGETSILAASYVNFYVANAAVVVPTYGVPQDDEACAFLQKCFPGRRVVGVDARAILSGGGAFHCITQQEPVG
jgi:agmatine deiminase